MSFDQSFLAPEADAYATRLARLPFDVMAVIEEDARKEGQPAVGRLTGGLLRALVAAAGGHRALEVGTNLGYSALWMASGLSDEGRLDTIELDDDLATRAEANFSASGVGRRITLHRGAALDVLPTLETGYDVVFLDAVKAEYPAYLDHAADLLRPGGVLAADNCFWLGRAWDAAADDADTRGVRVFTARVMEDEAWASTLVPVEDGLMVSVRRG